MELGKQMEQLIEDGLKRGLLGKEIEEEFEKRYLTALLRASGANQCKASRLGGMHRNTFARRRDKAKVSLPLARQYRKRVASVSYQELNHRALHGVQSA
jgi:DNA-binding NtrC family response regulator